jgi:4-amino-4-deoxy-L-arabinose transferase-like glycosyltransferase
VLIILVTFRLATLLWQEAAARRAAWFAALLPSSIIYSAILLREVAVVLPLVLAVYLLVRFRQDERSWQLVASAGLALVAGVFHPGALVVLPVIGGVAFRQAWSGALRGPGLAIMRASIVVALVVGAGLSVQSAGFGSYKLQGLYDQGLWLTVSERLVMPSERVLSRADLYRSTDCGTAMPGLLRCALLRPVEFVATPFPWDVSRSYDVARSAEATLFLALLFVLWLRRGRLRGVPEARTVTLIILALVVVFAFGSEEVAQGHRHRAKILPLVAALAAPIIPRLVLFPARRAAPTPSSQVAGSA